MANEEKLREYLRRVTVDLHETSERLREREERDNEPIAIVAMSCRYPGGVHSPDDLWDLVVEGRDAISGFPTDRGWPLEEVLDPTGTRSGASHTTEGGFLTGAGDFDPELFRISPSEALAMDPQQRLLLEMSWEAFERAGIDPLSVRGEPVAVFTGVMYHNHAATLGEVPEGVAAHLGTGSASSVLSGRVSYVFGIEGPSVTIDTACSSSLVALHLATQALRAGECTMALAGGVTVMPTPGAFVEYSNQGALAADGRCKPFAAAADGMGWSEGVGVLLLERLGDAVRNGHEVLAVVRGSSVNSDGASNGLTAPNGPSQQRVIRAALDAAGLAPSQVDAVEAHGTGTVLGDPIEAEALLATYGQGRRADRPLWLGSVKSNLGHAQAASGVAGVIKMVQAIRHGILPSSLHVDAPSPRIAWDSGQVALLTERRPWPETGEARRAGVSSFGMSGTNAHVVLEEAGGTAEDAVSPADSRHHLPSVPWVLSGTSPDAVRAQAARLLSHLDERPASAVDIGYSLATTRAALEHRAVVVAEDDRGFRAGLAAVAEGDPARTVVRGTASARPSVVFVFPGQGTHWVGMAAGLLDSSPTFSARFAECAAALAPHVDWAPEDVLRQAPGAPGLDRVDVVQPVLWAVMVSLAAVWRSHGVHPAAVVGHSQGEIAAACVAGALSLSDGARVVALRSRALVPLSGHGGMLAVVQSADWVEERLEPFGGRLSIAAVNGPNSVVVSGDRDALDELQVLLSRARVMRWVVPGADFAAHSRQIESLAEELSDLLDGVTPRPSTVPFCSTLTGGHLDAARLDGDYWYRNLRHTVDFESAAMALLADGHRVFLEISPHPVLGLSLQEMFGDLGAVALGTLRRDEDDTRRMVLSLAEAHANGVAIDWSTVFGPTGARRTDLPTYAFQHRTYWLASTTGHPGAGAGAGRASVLDSWRYRDTWPRTAEPEPREGTERTWLVVVPATDDAPDLVEDCLTALGTSDSRVLRIGIDADRPAISGALREAVADADVAAVLSLVALAGGTRAEHESVPRGLADTLLLSQALADAGLDAPLWIATSGAVSTGPADPVPHPEHALLWGFGGVLGAEHPERWGGLVDLPDRLDEHSGRRLRGVLTGTHTENQLAVRPAGLHARRLVRAPLGDAPPQRTWTPHGTILITGGTGALGSHVARWLARSGAEHLLLVSRRGPEAPGAADLVAELVDLGSRVTLVACDASDQAALARVLADVPDEFPLSAVMHTAALLDDGLVDSLSVDQLERVLRAKVVSALNLHELTRDLDLSAFVLFSSIGGVFGVPGQGGYAPGNAFLDAFARHRRALGLPATSVAWGHWAGGGIGAGSVEEGFARIGLRAMDPALTVIALRQALEHDETSLVVADWQWDRLTSANTAPSPLVRELPEFAGAASRAEPVVAARVRAATGADRRRVVLDAVRAEAAVLLGHDSAEDVPMTRSFQDLGFTSLTSLELRNRLAEATGLALPATLVFDHPTTGELADHLLAELVGGAPAADSADASRQTPGASDDPVVIVGMSCRFPGGVTSPDDLWRLVVEGTDAVTGFPTDRGWDLDELYHPDPGHPGTSYVDRGGFLHDAAEFDPLPFGISPREALAMDPQQRLLLEASWEALERAGIAPDSLRGSRTGVFAGTNGQDYGQLLVDAGDSVAGYIATGSSASVLSGRVAYTFGFEGPAMTVDTACSSSLVSMHLAAQALRTGECSLALAGGVTVTATPGVFIEFSRQRGLSPDGRCKAFADGADGTGWGEGVGVLVLERLSDARRNGHPVLAVVRGSAVNSDGASNGLTAPNGPSQHRVIRQALANAGLSTSDVDVVEAHGTGTTLGDPIEAGALVSTYGRDRDEDRPLLIGSVKSNIGHTQAASGAAGVIKMVLALHRGLVPRTLHVEEPSSHVDWTGVSVATENVPWPAVDRPRRAGISSFGISGTNAHLVLEHVEEDREPEREDTTPPAVLPWVISAKSAPALDAQAAALLDHVDTRPDLDPVDVAWSLATTRASLDHRAAVVGTSRDELRAGLVALVEGGTRSIAATSGTARFAVLFPGQGSQRHGMGRGLHQAYPRFAQAFDEVCALFGPHLAEPLRDVVFGQGTPLDDTEYTQAGLFAVEVALYRLVESWGLVPDFLLGHSIGEVTAAHVAGVLSLADAVTLVAARGRLMAALPPGGAMVSVRATETEVLPLLTEAVSLAAVNGPDSVVLSGDEDAVLAVAGHFATSRRLRVSHAFHSSRMDAVLDDFRAVAEGLTYHDPSLPIVSNLTGQLVTSEVTDPAYWVRHVREAVRFHQGIRCLRALDVRTFVELGPTGVLSAMGRDCLAPEDTAGVDFVPALRGERAEARTTIEALTRLHARGAAPDWAAFFSGAGARRVALPTYAFQHERFWPRAAPTPTPTVDRWRYQITWRPVHPRPAHHLTGTWLVVLPPDSTGHPVVDGLAARGAEPVAVRGTRGLAAALAEHPTPGGVLSLLGTEDEPDVAETLDLVRSLADVPTPLWCLTSGAVSTSVDDPVRHPHQAQVWGLGRVVGLEAPRGWGGLVDLPSPLTEDALERLCAVLADGGEDQLAIRAGGVLARRLTRDGTGDPGESWSPRGTVLITGGTGALGGHVARWAARHGAAHLVLVSRRGPEAPGAEELRADLTDLGARVTIAACDVTDHAALAELVSSLDDVRAVVHAAGVAHLTPLLDVTPAEVDAVCAGKVAGAAALDAAFAETPLDAFVLFSSISGVWGSGGQAAYAAANAYLDALAADRRARGLVATSISWGPWDSGMTDADVEERLRRRGVRVLATEDALAALRRALAEDDTTVTVADVDWHRFVPTYTAARPSRLFEELVDAAPAGPPQPAGTTRFDGLTPAERAATTLELVRAEAASVLGHRDTAAIHADTAFHELGFDSLTAVELRDRLAAETGIRLPASLVFDHPAPALLAEHLQRALTGSTPEAVTPAAETPVGEDAVAVIGMSCRLPGGVDSPAALWRLLDTGTDAVSAFPTDRGWDLGSDHGYTPAGGFLHDAGEFDAEFFGISPREALAMDPQQRLFLESSWEAIERAGIDPGTLRGSRTGVFAGAAALGYASGTDGAADDVAGHLLTGNATSVLSGRIAYTFGFEGPAVTLDTACSSSLVALHLAVRALRGGECTMALAGGVAVMATPDTFAEFGRQGGLAADGRCKSFAASADGTGWAEGVAVLLVQRLSDAIRDGHEVLAVVRGSAVNSDGASNGLTAPNGPSQQRVIRQALANARLSPADVDVVEAHGTGTALGDPIEAQALLATYGQDRPEGRPLWLGSLKSNIGHTQAAAGVAGVIKMITAMRHGTLPRTLHVTEPTPAVDWGTGAVSLLTEPRPWPADGRPRRAAVSAFGISGTNAHTIIESPPAREETPAVAVPAAPLLLSARSEGALRAQASRLLAYWDEKPGTPVQEVAHTLATGRTRFPCRAAVDTREPGDVLAALRALSEGTEAPGLTTGTAETGPTAFLFSGQGSQRAGMGRALHEAYPVFAAAFDAACPVRDVVFDGGDLLDRTEYTQLALFGIEVALFRLLESWGVRPDYVMGHSVGELAAAHVAGVLSLEDALTLVTARARLMGALPAGGAMVSVRATEAEVAPLLGEGVSLAAVNGPESVVLSGSEAEVIEAVARLGDRRTRRLRVSHAFHSARMEPVLDDLRAVARRLTYARPSIPVVSTLTGRLVDDELTDPSYWVRQLRDTVRFADGMAWLDERGVRSFVELGPDTADPSALAAAVARAHVRGTPVDWRGFFSGSPRRADLPTYPFQRERFWLAATREGGTDARFWSAVRRRDLAALGGLTADQPLGEALPALMAWHERSTSLSAIDSWRYRVGWHALPDHPTARLHGTWLVVSRGVADASVLAGGLRAGGAHVVEVADPVAGTGHADIAGVVALLDHGGDAATTVLSLVRALDGSGITAPLWCLTRGAVSVTADDAPSAPDQAQAWGLGRVAALDCPGQWGGLVDLPAALDDAALGRVVSVLADGGEDQVAVRQSGTFARRIGRAAAGHGRRWRTSGTTLISGGTGALGRRVARWVAERGADHVVLVSRRGGDTPDAETIRAELADTGVRVTFAACDVTDRPRLADLRREIEDAGDRVRVVVHAAGTGQLTPLTRMSATELADVRDGKVLGAENLDAVFDDTTLDAFVLFSSISGIWGSGGQGAYAAANAALDALAEQRRTEGRTATSIAWGPWAEGGMSGGADAEEHLGRRGLPLMAPHRALLALEEALADDETAIVVADLDWARFVPAYTALRPSRLFDEVPEARERETAEPAVSDRVGALRAALTAATPADQDRILLDLVRAEAAAALGHRSQDAVRARAGFVELGFDSLTAVELRDRITASTGLRLPATLVFDHPNAAALAARLRTDLAPAPSGDVAAEVDRLERALAAHEPGQLAEDLGRRLRALVDRWVAPPATQPVAGEFQDASPEDMFEIIQREFGKSP
ncbi:Acyl transferase domain-containing protein [Actinoalloteichus cyanogriseus DSM 43889]|uniref:Acyl transferase domain-containing protein n=3 Tax=Actinoalloteichus cyanogriseus TaxID=2893586 RepID=A0ABT1JEL5_ACTCY|nr:type I polyketide synthase [Actinoalloteichus caeruleus]MCP2330613.1 Acyl transferase domain-containing protein [Actinoalloteichus caeruleus DSM 43889]